jgi:DNA-binding response OmpR family regulator
VLLKASRHRVDVARGSQSTSLTLHEFALLSFLVRSRR